MKKAWLLLLILVAVFGFSGSAGAALTVIGTANYEDKAYNLIYMDDGPFGPITWLDYTRSNYINSGYQYWYDQTAWASNLSFAEADIQLNPGYTTSIDWSTGWRLPETVDGPYDVGDDGTTTAGFNITTSEMGYLFYEALGNKGYYDASGNAQSGYGLINTGDFDNLKASSYWSGNWDYDSPESNFAWFFDFYFGAQDIFDKSAHSLALGENIYALAVRPGDVSAVPLPAAVWLLGSGLIGLVGFRKKFKKS